MLTPEQQALLEKANLSLPDAEVLAGEGMFSFAVSRAYYAMFYTAEALLLARGLSYSRHSAVIAAFGREFVKTGLVSSDHHQDLIEGQDQRNVGDYDIMTFATAEQAEAQLDRARRFVATGESVLAEL